MDKIKELLICGICQEPLANAVNLDPCHHLFCSYCLISAKRSLCPLCNSRIINIHSCSKVFMNNITEIAFGNEYRDSVTSKLKFEYENTLKREITASLPVDPPTQVVRYVQAPPMPGNKWASYMVIGLLLMFMSLIILNLFYLVNLNSGLKNLV